jgi:hypothetical protein
MEAAGTVLATATYPLARAEEALALVESRHASGKLVIDMRL